MRSGGIKPLYLLIRYLHRRSVATNTLPNFKRCSPTLWFRKLWVRILKRTWRRQTRPLLVRYAITNRQRCYSAFRTRWQAYKKQPLCRLFSWKAELDLQLLPYLGGSMNHSNMWETLYSGGVIHFYFGGKVTLLIWSILAPLKHNWPKWTVNRV